MDDDGVLSVFGSLSGTLSSFGNFVKLIPSSPSLIVSSQNRPRDWAPRLRLDDNPNNRNALPLRFALPMGTTKKKKLRRTNLPVWSIRKRLSLRTCPTNKSWRKLRRRRKCCTRWEWNNRRERRLKDITLTFWERRLRSCTRFDDKERWRKAFPRETLEKLWDKRGKRTCTFKREFQPYLVYLLGSFIFVLVSTLIITQ